MPTQAESVWSLGAKMQLKAEAKELEFEKEKELREELTQTDQKLCRVTISAQTERKYMNRM